MCEAPAYWNKILSQMPKTNPWLGDLLNAQTKPRVLVRFV